MLENVDLQQSFRQRIADKRKSKLSRHANSNFMPIQDGEDDEVDGWAEPDEQLSSGNALLSKYDDVEDFALKKKRANRIQIGKGAQSNQAKEAQAKKTKTDERDFNSTSFGRKTIGSDYYATNEEDPLAPSTTTSFKKSTKAGTKRNRMVNTMALADNEAE